jgi:hypothetical protein
VDDLELVVGVGRYQLAGAVDEVAENLLVPGGGGLGGVHDLAAAVAGARAGLAGRITTLASAVVLAVSLVYDITLIAFAQSAALGGRQTATALVAYGLFAATEHVFLLAPPLFLALGLILLRTAILPRVFALLAVTFGVIAPFLGLAGLFAVTANNNGPVGAAINALVAAEALWIIAASLTLALRKPQASLPEDDHAGG